MHGESCAHMESEFLLAKVKASLHRLAAIADEHGGLFPSVLEPETGRMPWILPPAIKSQRDNDRSFPGSNLMHDHSVLHVMYGLEDQVLAQAADRYLQRFATHCTDTPTGLFPWGEHSFWNLSEDRAGNSFPLNRDYQPIIHDHLLQAPLWLWEKLWEYNPSAVERFCRGLDGHFKTGEPLEYIRHAPLLDTQPQTFRAGRSYDFPRHSGFYLLDWAFALSKTSRGEYADRVAMMMDYWWDRRSPDNRLQSESRSPESARDHYNIISLTQTLSLGVSLLDAAALLQESHPELAAKLRRRGVAYTDAFVEAPHDPDAGRFANELDLESGRVMSCSSTWGSSYGSGKLAAGSALLCLSAYRHLDDPRCLEFASAVARHTVRETWPADAHVPVKDPGVVIGVLADLYDLTGQAEWLEKGLQLAEPVLAIYFDCDLPRGASGIGIYESQLLPGYFFHGLARMALLARDRNHCPLGPDYSLR